LVTAHVGDPGLEEALRDREDPLPSELLAFAEAEFLDLGGE
jgi:hypothetical protein